MTPSARSGVAVVGAGMASVPYWQSLADLRDTAQVRWLVGRSMDRIAEVRRKHFPEAGVTTALAQALADPGVSTVFLLTPPSTHLQLALQCAAAGKHALVEKPVGLGTAETAEVVQAFEAAGLHLGVMLQHRLRPAALALKRLMAAHSLGRLTTAAVQARWWRAQSYYDEPGRGTLARDGGGVLVTQAIHVLDLFIHLVGLPTEVFAFAETSAVHSMECEDVVAAAVRLQGGGIATVNATTAAFPGFAESIDISGSLGSATLSAGRLRVAWLDGRTEEVGEQESLGAGADPMAFSHQAHRAVIQDFLAALASGQAPAICGRSLLDARRLIDAILQSRDAGRPVNLVGQPEGPL